MWFVWHQQSVMLLRVFEALRAERCFSPTPAPVSNAEVSSLDHEVLDDSVKLGAFVAVTFLQTHKHHSAYNKLHTHLKMLHEK